MYYSNVYSNIKKCKNECFDMKLTRGVYTSKFFKHLHIGQYSRCKSFALATFQSSTNNSWTKCHPPVLVRFDLVFRCGRRVKIPASEVAEVKSSTFTGISSSVSEHNVMSLYFVFVTQCVRNVYLSRCNKDVFP